MENTAAGAHTAGAPAMSRSSTSSGSPARRSDDEEDPFADIIAAGEKLTKSYAALEQGMDAELPPALRAEAREAAFHHPPEATTAPSSPNAGEAPPAEPLAPSPPAAPNSPAWTVVPPSSSAPPPTKLAEIIAADVARQREARTAPPIDPTPSIAQ